MSGVAAPLELGPLLDALRGVKWPTRARVRAGLPGSHRANQRGTTGEFTEFRAYRQGDDPRRIDWRLLARSDRAYVRITDERAWWPTWLLVDASGSMAFPDGPDSTVDKWTMARSLAVGLSAVALATGDPVGLMVSARPEPLRMPPRTRRGTVAALASALDRVTPRESGALAALFARVPTGARVVLCTDLLGETDALLAAIARAVAAGSEVTVLQVVHPLELDPPRGVWRAVDPELPSLHRPLTNEGHAAYRAAFDAWRADVGRRVMLAGARHHEVSCAEVPARAVRRVARAW